MCGVGAGVGGFQRLPGQVEATLADLPVEETGTLILVLIFINSCSVICHVTFFSFPFPISTMNLQGNPLLIPWRVGFPLDSYGM